MKSQIYRELVSTIGEEKVTADTFKLRVHSQDSSFHKSMLPSVVVYPESTTDVRKIINYAFMKKVPITARGGGSSLEGNSIPIKGGISLDMTRMNRIIKLYRDDQAIKVQPGILGKDLNNFLSRYNLFFPAFPGSMDVATAGGMVATNAGGMYGLAYGVVGDWVLGLTVVSGNGEILHLGSRSYKSVAGYDLKRLIIGSDGTLGIITEILFKLKRKFDARCTFIIHSEKEQQLILTGIKILQRTKPTALEFLNKSYIKLINTVNPDVFKEESALIVEFLGSEEEIEMYKNEMLSVIPNNITVKPWTNFGSDKDIWELRKSVRPVLKQMFKERGVLTADIGIVQSAVFLFLKAVFNLGRKNNLDIPVFGHFGDWNFHVWIMYDVSKRDSYQKAIKINEKIVETALKLGGTSTAEHGIGIGKKKFMIKEHPDQIKIYTEIKRIFDPMGILNPGKMIS